MKKESIFLAIFLVFLCMPSFANADRIDVIANGDFESGSTAGWTIDNPAHYSLWVTSLDADGVAGPLGISNVLHAVPGPNSIHISQSVSLVAGAEYTLSANLSATNGGYNLDYYSGQVYARLGSTLLDEYDFGRIYSGSWEYATLDATFTAPTSGMFDFDIQLYRPSSVNRYVGLNIDNISLAYNSPSPVPEPATLLLLGTGFIGLAGLGRKRLRKVG